MSGIRCVWRDAPPAFPASDQHPDAGRYRFEIANQVYYVDAVGGRPEEAQVEAALAAGAPPFTATAERLEQHLETAIAEFAAPKKEVLPKKEAPTVTASSPGAHALTIKDVLDEHTKKLDQVLQAQMALLQTELDGQLGTVVKGTDAVIARVRGHTDDFKAVLGQFINEG